MSEAGTTRAGWRPRWRRAALTLAVAGVAAAVGLAWWGWGRGGSATPPAVPAGADPAVAEAVEAFRRRVLGEPKSAAAWGELGEVLLANGYPDEADACSARAEALDPGEPRWLYLHACNLLPRDREAGLDLFRRAAEQCRRDDAYAETARLRLGEELLAVGRVEEAEVLYRRFLEGHPANVRAQFGMGLAAAARDDARGAVVYLARCTDSPFVRKRACAELAVLYRRLGDGAAAEDYGGRAGRAPKDAEWPDPYFDEYARGGVGKEARFLQAEELQHAGRLEEAAALCRALLKDYPDDAPAHIELGMALDQMGDFAAAEREYRTALRLSPDKVQAHYYLSVALFHQAGTLDHPSDPAARALYQEAADSARTATQLKPDHAFAHLYLGLCLKELGRRDEALVSLRRAVVCNPASAEPHLYLGEALAEAGLKEEAIAELERAVRAAAADDERPREALKKWREVFGKTG